MVLLRSKTPLIQLLYMIQKKRPEESCDTQIVCQDGFITCHRYVLMAHSPFLRQLILDNLLDIGPLDAKMPSITLNFAETKTEHMKHVLALFYCGKTLGKIDDMTHVNVILQQMGVPQQYPVMVEETTTTSELRPLHKPRIYLDPETDSENEVEDDKIPRGPDFRSMIPGSSQSFLSQKVSNKKVKVDDSYKKEVVEGRQAKARSTKSKSKAKKKSPQLRQLPNLNTKVKKETGIKIEAVEPDVKPVVKSKGRPKSKSSLKLLKKLELPPERIPCPRKVNIVRSYLE